MAFPGQVVDVSGGDVDLITREFYGLLDSNLTTVALGAENGRAALDIRVKSCQRLSLNSCLSMLEIIVIIIIITTIIINK